MMGDFIDPYRSSLFVGYHFSAQPLRSSRRCVQMLALLRHLCVSSLKCTLGISPLLSRMMWEIWLQVSLFPYCSHQCHLFWVPLPRKTGTLHGHHPNLRNTSLSWDASVLFTSPCHLSSTFLFTAEKGPTLPPRLDLKPQLPSPSPSEFQVSSRK